MSASAKSASEHGKEIALDDDPSLLTSVSKSRSDASGFSDGISVLCSTRYSSLPSSRKRRGNPIDDSGPPEGRKRLQLDYHDGYRKIFNQSIHLGRLSPCTKKQRPSKSHVGASQWSSQEKETFFDAVTRRGRHDLRAIALDVGTKSESEVRIYAQMLHNAAARHEVQVPRHKTFHASRIEAATEISSECDAALDIAAEALAVLEQRKEQIYERKKHQKYWLLTPSTAKWVDRTLTCDGRDGDGEVREAVPAAELLNLGHFLQLSKRFFMNSSVMSNNYRTFTERRKAPNIMYTAFTDFHTVATSLTKRLVQSAIFVSSSRSRIERNYGAPSKSVRRDDVLAAINILGLKRNAKDFWTGVARRHNHVVYRRVKRCDIEMTYDEVEKSLDTKNHRRQTEVHQMGNEESDYLISRRDFTDSPGSVADCSDVSSEAIPLATSEVGTFASKPESQSSDSNPNEIGLRAALPQYPEAHGELHDRYLEAMDQKASQKSERNLWEMLSETSKDEPKVAQPVIPRKPPTPARNKEDLDDWRLWTTYAGIWETLPMTEAGADSLGSRIIGRSRDLEPIIQRRIADQDKMNKWHEEQRLELQTSDSEHVYEDE